MSTLQISLSKFAWVMIAALLLLGGILVYKYPPETSWGYLPCLWYQLTGLLCPGCGSQRALHLLLHGNFSEAFLYNQLLVSALGALIFFVVLYKFGMLPHTLLHYTKKTSFWLYLLLLALLFAVLRNLPGTPFSFPPT